MPSFRARRNNSALGGMATGAATGALMGNVPGAIIGAGAGLLSGFFGMKKTPEIPELNARDMAEDIARRDPTIMQMLSQGRGAISQGTEQYRQQLIASGMDAGSASRMASERGQSSLVELGDKGVQAGERLKSNLYQQLLPQQLEREEDILSIKNMYDNQENAGVAMLPGLMAAGIAKADDMKKVGETVAEGGMATGGTASIGISPEMFQSANPVNASLGAGMNGELFNQDGGEMSIDEWLEMMRLRGYGNVQR